MRRAVVSLACLVLVLVAGCAQPVQRIQFRQACSVPTTWKFMFTGDSQTAGWSPGLPQHRPYWSWLTPRLWMVPIQSVGSQTNTYGVNEGIPGRTASQLLGQIDGLLDTYNPDVVVLDIGTNYDTDGPTTLGYVTQIVDKILARSCPRLLVAASSLHYDDWRSAVQKYVGDRIPAMVAARDPNGTRLRWVSFKQMTYAMTVDKLHGTERMEDIKSWFVYDQIQHFVGSNGYLPQSAIDLPFMPESTGSK